MAPTPPRDVVSTLDSPVILGLWPMAGITSEIVDQATNLRTLHAAVDAGIRLFDTAYSYGYAGESDRLLGQLVAQRSERVFVIGKVAQRWTADRRRVVDASPRQLTADAHRSLERLGIEAFDLLMLHSVDPQVPIERSAEALVSLSEQGNARAIGVCNVDLGQLRRFASVHRPAAVQLPLNLLQPEPLADIVPWCREREIAVHAYWALMKGILAGRIGRDHHFGKGDSRPKYAIYQGAARERTHRLVDQLAALGRESGLSVAQISIGWVLAQPGVSSVLVGAKRPEQIQETALSRPLPAEIMDQVNALARKLDV